MDKTKKYKLVDRDGYTRRGESGETYWLDGRERIAIGKGTTLCTEQVIHYYADPYLAVLFNPIHAKIANPRLIVIEIDKECASDGLKGGCKKAKFIKEIEIPQISVDQKVIFAIKVSLKFYKDEKFNKWGINWLNGNDRTEAAARAAWVAAGAAECAWAAAGAAEATWVAAGAAEAAARAAAEAARAAAEVGAAGAAARAAEAAARAAAGVAEVVNVTRFFIRTIKGIIKNGQN